MIREAEIPTHEKGSLVAATQKEYVRRDFAEAKKRNVVVFEIFGNEYTKKGKGLLKTVSDVASELNKKAFNKIVDEFKTNHPDYDEKKIAIHELFYNANTMFRVYKAHSVTESDGVHVYVEAHYELPEEYLRRAEKKYDAMKKPGAKNVFSKRTVIEAVQSASEFNDVMIPKLDTSYKEGYKAGYMDALLLVLDKLGMKNERLYVEIREREEL